MIFIMRPYLEGLPMFNIHDSVILLFYTKMTSRTVLVRLDYLRSVDRPWFIWRGWQLEVNCSHLTYLEHFPIDISIVGGCLVNKLSSTEGTEEADRESYAELKGWERTLPDDFRNIPSTITFDRGFWPAVIHLLY